MANLHEIDWDAFERIRQLYLADKKSHEFSEYHDGFFDGLELGYRAAHGDIPIEERQEDPV